MTRLTGLMAVKCAMVLALWTSPASAAPAGPLGLGDCREIEGVHQCSGLVATWDGVPLDTTVTLPVAGARGLPLVVAVHGFGNSKHEYLDPASSAYTGHVYEWARAGYAVLSHTARGLWGSCGTPEARLASPTACARGWIHLADTRYEVRDAQELTGRLVDEGVVDPRRIGVTGDSYGGGQSLALAALRDRVMLPDGRMIPWRSPRGTPIRLAAAAPVIPWSDLVSAIAPNGRTLTTTVAPPDVGSTPVGVFKLSVANAIFAAAQLAIGPGQPVGEPFVPGRPMGYLAPPGLDPESDVAGWVARADAGEPYTDARAREIVERLRRYHSAYGVPRGPSPPPLLLASGFSDDLFPVDEVVRFANRMRRDHPRTPVSLVLGDFGHQRAANKPADRARLLAAIRAWFDHHVRGDGARPPAGVTATTQTCPREAPSEGPFHARELHALARGEVRRRWERDRVVRSVPGDLQTGLALDPATGGGDGCAVVPVRSAAGTATYRLPAAPAGGLTLLGAPAVLARLDVRRGRGTAQLVARLWDVAPDGRTQRLVARALLRPSGRPRDVWQLHPNGWRFAAGHVPALELLGADPPYARPSNAAFSVRVEHLELRLPVRQRPDCRRVLTPAAPVRLPGQRLAPGVGRAFRAPACTPRRG